MLVDENFDTAYGAMITRSGKAFKEESSETMADALMKLLVDDQL